MFGNNLAKAEKAVAKNKPNVLIGLLSNKDEAVRIAAIDGLGKLKSNDGMNPLINLLHDPSANIRRHAALGLAAIGDGHAKAHISFAIEKESDASARDGMQQALLTLKNY